MSYSFHFPRQHCLDIGRALHVFCHGDGVQRLQERGRGKLPEFRLFVMHGSDQKNSPQPTRARGKVPFVTREDGRRLGRAFCFRIRIGEANGDKSSVHQCFCLQVSIVRSFGSHECSEVNLFPINLNLRSERLSTLRRTANTKVSTGSVVLGRVCSVLVVELVICRAQICYAVVIAQSIDVINWETWPFSVINSPCQPMGSMALSEYADIPIALLSQYSCDVPGINTKARRYAPNNYSSFWVVLQTTSDVVYKSIQLRLFGRGLVAKHLGGFLDAQHAIQAIRLGPQCAKRYALDLELPCVWRVLAPLRNRTTGKPKRSRQSDIAAVVINCFLSFHAAILVP